MSRFRWTPAEVEAALGVRGTGATPPGAYAAVATDTRELPGGSLFVALRGERFDAHALLGQAAAAGASGAVVSRLPDDAPEGLVYYRVEHTLHALGRLARHRRRALRARVVGVTGTNGKTTTKDLLRAALGARYRVHATEGNLNNQVGVPLTLLAAPDGTEALVVEMGMNSPGEIGILTAIAEPEAGVVTSVGAGHLELVGSVHGVLIEKTALLAGLPAGGEGFVADEPACLPARAVYLLGEDRVRRAGYAEDAHLRPDGGLAGVQVLEDGTSVWGWRGEEVHLPLRGRHNVSNALLALGLAEAWGVAVADAVRGIREMPPPRLRGEWRFVGQMRVIADCYNANPASLAAAVDLLATLPAAGRKVAVLGTMRELGTGEEELHRAAAREVAHRIGRGVDLVVATGAFVSAFRTLAPELGGALVAVEDPVAAFHAVADRLEGNETILLKASRGEALERWLELLEGGNGRGEMGTDARAPLS